MRVAFAPLVELLNRAMLGRTGARVVLDGESVIGEVRAKARGEDWSGVGWDAVALASKLPACHVVLEKVQVGYYRDCIEQRPQRCG